MTAITTFTVTVYGPESWCDPARADQLADLIADQLAGSAQRIADVAPSIPDGAGVRVLVVEDLGPGPLMRNFRAMAVTPREVAPVAALPERDPAPVAAPVG